MKGSEERRLLLALADAVEDALTHVPMYLDFSGDPEAMNHLLHLRAALARVRDATPERRVVQ